MHKALRALAGGVAATTVMVVALVVMDVETRSRLLLFEALARFFGLPEQVTLGFVIFLLFGSVIWPLLFAVIEPYLPPGGDPAVSGMLFAGVLWVAFLVVGTGGINSILIPLYAVMTLLAHLAYGFTLGLVYGWTVWAPSARTADQGA